MSSSRLSLSRTKTSHSDGALPSVPIRRQSGGASQWFAAVCSTSSPGRICPGIMPAIRFTFSIALFQRASWQCNQTGRKDAQERCRTVALGDARGLPGRHENGEAVPGVLFPDFVDRVLPTGRIRNADVQLKALRSWSRCKRGLASIAASRSRSSQSATSATLQSQVAPSFQTGTGHWPALISF